MKKYAVYYLVPMEFESVVEAKNKKDAIRKVKEVIGEETKITASWQVLKDVGGLGVAVSES